MNSRSLSVDLFQSGKAAIPFVSSSGEKHAEEEHLLNIHYLRLAKESLKYKGIDQNVQIRFSTLTFQASPEPVVSLYDFIMSTFTSDRGPPTIAPHQETPDERTLAGAPPQQSPPVLRDNIVVAMRLSSVKGIALFLIYVFA